MDETMDRPRTGIWNGEIRNSTSMGGRGRERGSQNKRVGHKGSGVGRRQEDAGGVGGCQHGELMGRLTEVLVSG